MSRVILISAVAGSNVLRRAPGLDALHSGGWHVAREGPTNPTESLFVLLRRQTVPPADFQ